MVSRTPLDLSLFLLLFSLFLSNHCSPRMVSSRNISGEARVLRPGIFFFFPCFSLNPISGWSGLCPALMYLPPTFLGGGLSWRRSDFQEKVISICRVLFFFFFPLELVYALPWDSYERFFFALSFFRMLSLLLETEAPGSFKHLFFTISLQQNFVERSLSPPHGSPVARAQDPQRIRSPETLRDRTLHVALYDFACLISDRSILKPSYPISRRSSSIHVIWKTFFARPLPF